MACTVKTCCCCFSLKTGTILAALYTMIFGIFGSVFCVRLIIMLRSGRTLMEFVQEVLGQSENPQGLDTYFTGDTEEQQTALDVAQIVVWVQLGIFLFWIFTAILVFIAVCCKTRCCLIPWVITTAIITGFAIWGIVGHVRLLISKGTLANTWDLAYFVVQCIITLLDFYCVLVVSSFHKRNMEEFEEVEMERYGPDDY